MRVELINIEKQCEQDLVNSKGLTSVRELIAIIFHLLVHHIFLVIFCVSFILSDFLGFSSLLISFLAASTLLFNLNT